MEGIAKREENSTDHTTSNNGQEAINADQFTAEENAAGSSISPRRKVLLITGLSLMPILWKSRKKLCKGSKK